MSKFPEQAEGSQSTDEPERKGGSGSPVHQKPGASHPVVPNPDVSYAPEGWALNIFESKSSSASDGRQEVLNKMSVDLLALMERTTAIEGQLKSMASNLGQLQKALESAARGQTIELERLKEKLISDRKELIGRGTFNAIRPAIESLNFMIEIHRDRPEDEAMTRQTRNVLDLLTGITQFLGYRPFEVAPGDDFNPHTMECSGYEPGAVGKVVRVDQPGYVAGDVMVCPCKVVLGHTAND